MGIFFYWWKRRIEHLFTGEKKKEPFFQKAITCTAIFIWGAVVFFLCCLVLGLILTRRVRIKGRENVKDMAPQDILACANHGSLIGPGLVPFAWRMFKMLFDPQKYFIWQTPRQNVINAPLMRLGILSPIIPVKFDKDGVSSDSSALKAMTREIKNHTFLIFPEGTRSYHSQEPHHLTKSGVLIGSPLLGAGYIVYKTRPRVVPILIKNEDYFLPHKKPLLSALLFDMIPKTVNVFGPSIKITFGKPIDFSYVPSVEERIGRGDLKKICKDVSARIMDEIAALDEC